MSNNFKSIFSRLFSLDRRRGQSMTLMNCDWAYKGEQGPENWHINFPVAAGTHQSPVDIEASSLIYDTTLDDLRFSGYHSCPRSERFLLKNTGYTVKVTFPYDEDLSIEGGCLSSKYAVDQFHFHWGSKNDRGSEHLINGQSYPMELHIVHKNLKYKNEDVHYKADGVTVLAIFITVGETEHDGMKNIIDNLKHVKYKGQETNISSFPLSSLLPVETGKFYHYIGSLTAPPCNECVTWIIFHQPIAISQEQINEFRSLFGTPQSSTEQVRLVDNYRPVQPLYKRTIAASLKLQEGCMPQHELTDILD